MKRILYLFLGLAFLITFSGCGKNCSVTGKVTLSDGSPVTVGEVVFETPASISRGTIQKDGTYTMITGELKGVPKGTYKVSIGGFMPTIEMPSSPKIVDGRPVGPPGRPKVTMPTIPFDKKFLAASTSGLTCEVKGRTTYDIKLEPPSGAEPKKK